MIKPNFMPIREALSNQQIEWAWYHIKQASRSVAVEVLSNVHMLGQEC